MKWPSLIPLPFTIVLMVGVWGLSQNVRISSLSPSPAVADEQSLVISKSEQPDPKPVILARTMVSQDDIELGLKRPLFSPERRPGKLLAKGTVPAAEEPISTLNIKTPPPEFTLHGVLKTGDVVRALISAPGKSPIWMQRNDLILGWTLGNTGSEAVDLINGPERITIKLYSSEQ